MFFLRDRSRSGVKDFCLRRPAAPLLRRPMLATKNSQIIFLRGSTGIDGYRNRMGSQFTQLRQVSEIIFLFFLPFPFFPSLSFPAAPAAALLTALLAALAASPYLPMAPAAPACLLFRPWASYNHNEKKKMNLMCEKNSGGIDCGHRVEVSTYWKLLLKRSRPIELTFSPNQKKVSMIASNHAKRGTSGDSLREQLCAPPLSAQDKKGASEPLETPYAKSCVILF